MSMMGGLCCDEAVGARHAIKNPTTINLRELLANVGKPELRCDPAIALRFYYD